MKESNTLGRRIQEGRRAAGLSQEALGERLNVSRQAVSKWEADAAVPELENLIAMSRVFGVSIGELLGVEPPEKGPPEEPPEADGGLTEKELAAVEAIAAKYAAEAQRHQRSGWPKRRKVIAAALTVGLVLAAGALLKRQMESIDRRFDEMQRQVNGIESSVSGQINALTWQMSDILDEKNNILSNSQAIVTAFDPRAQTVTLRVSASPREGTDTTTASFTATLSDGRQFTAEGTRQSGAFTVEGLVVPMDSAIRLSVTLMDNGSARTGAMETLYDCLPGNFTFWVDGSWDASWSSGSSRVTLSGLNLHIESAIISSYPLELFPEAVDLCLYRNQETEPEQTIPVTEAVSLFREAGYTQMYNGEDYRTSFDLSKGDTMAVTVRVTDNYGQTTWTVLNAYRFVGGMSDPVESLGFGSIDSWVPGTSIP